VVAEEEVAVKTVELLVKMVKLLVTSQRKERAPQRRRLFNSRKDPMMAMMGPMIPPLQRLQPPESQGWTERPLGKSEAVGVKPRLTRKSPSVQGKSSEESAALRPHPYRKINANVRKKMARLSR
jgi:hypothetical protein